MTRTMADSIDANALPTNVDLWGMYVNGKWPTFYQRIPPSNIRVVRISINAQTDADVNDVESGDLAPYDVIDAMKLNPYATIYASRASWFIVKAVCKNSNVPLPPWWAAVPGFSGIYPGSIATQNRQAVGCDFSTVADYWPGFDTFDPPLEEEEQMFIVRDTSTSREYLQTSDGKLHYLGSPSSVSAYVAAGLHIITPDPRDIVSLLKIS